MCASLQGDGGPIGGGAMCSSRRGDVLCAGAAEGGARVAGTRTPRPGRGRVQCGLLLLAALGAAGLVEDPDAPVHAGQPTAAWTGAHPSAEGTDHAGRHVTHVGGCPTLSGGRGGGLLSATRCAEMNATAQPLTMRTRSFARTGS